jgi:hypothetical protein
MANEGREYKYQADFTLGGQMYHVRCDDWDEFQTAVTNIKDTYILDADLGTVTTKTYNTPYSKAPYPTPASESACKTCGAETLPEKKIQGKDGRSWWVRDCSTGDRTHKGPIRPAS